jgi:hypothetical protein
MYKYSIQYLCAELPQANTYHIQKRKPQQTEMNGGCNYCEICRHQRIWLVINVAQQTDDKYCRFHERSYGWSLKNISSLNNSLID